MESFMEFLANTIITPVLPFFLLVSGLFLNIRLHFLPFTKIKTVLKTLTHKESADGVSPMKVPYK